MVKLCYLLIEGLSLVGTFLVLAATYFQEIFSLNNFLKQYFLEALRDLEELTSS